jgi:hypothetical protein
MSILQSIIPISYGIGILGISGAVFSFVRYNNYKGTVELQNDNIKALEDQAKIHSQMLDNNKITIEKLNARINVVESLPLEAILTELKNISNTQNKMLKNLISKK